MNDYETCNFCDLNSIKAMEIRNTYLKVQSTKFNNNSFRLKMLNK